MEVLLGYLNLRKSNAASESQFSHLSNKDDHEVLQAAVKIKRDCVHENTLYVLQSGQGSAIHSQEIKISSLNRVCFLLT